MIDHCSYAHNLRLSSCEIKRPEKKVMILGRAPQMLKKSGIKKGNGMNYLTFMVLIVPVSV